MSTTNQTPQITLGKVLLLATFVLSISSAFLVPKETVEAHNGGSQVLTKLVNDQQEFEKKLTKKESCGMDIPFCQSPVVVSSSSLVSSSETKANKEEPKVEEPIKVEAPKEEIKVEQKAVVETGAKSDCLFDFNRDIQNAVNKASEEYGIDCRYLITIGLSENIYAPHKVGDNGCSFGIYQMNICVHKTTTLNPSVMDCAKDFLCSSRWTANRVKNKYMANYPNSFIFGLSQHHGQVYCPSGRGKCAVAQLTGELWYQEKITKNAIIAGLELK